METNNAWNAWSTNKGQGKNQSIAHSLFPESAESKQMTAAERLKQQLLTQEQNPRGSLQQNKLTSNDSSNSSKATTTIPSSSINKQGKYAMIVNNQSSKDKQMLHSQRSESEGKNSWEGQEKSSVDGEDGLNKTCVKKKTTGPVHNTRYKAKMCKNWIKIGSCPYFEKCQFAHGSHELEKWANRRQRVKSDDDEQVEGKSSQSIESNQEEEEADKPIEEEEAKHRESGEDDEIGANIVTLNNTTNLQQHTSSSSYSSAKMENQHQLSANDIKNSCNFNDKDHYQQQENVTNSDIETQRTNIAWSKGPSIVSRLEQGGGNNYNKQAHEACNPETSSNHDNENSPSFLPTQEKLPQRYPSSPLESGSGNTTTCSSGVSDGSNFFSNRSTSISPPDYNNFIDHSRQGNKSSMNNISGQIGGIQSSILPDLNARFGGMNMSGSGVKQDNRSSFFPDQFNVPSSTIESSSIFLNQNEFKNSNATTTGNNGYGRTNPLSLGGDLFNFTPPQKDNDTTSLSTQQTFTQQQHFKTSSSFDMKEMENQQIFNSTGPINAEHDLMHNNNSRGSYLQQQNQHQYFMQQQQAYHMDGRHQQQQMPQMRHQQFQQQPHMNGQNNVSFPSMPSASAFRPPNSYGISQQRQTQHEMYNSTNNMYHNTFTDYSINQQHQMHSNDYNEFNKFG